MIGYILILILFALLGIAMIFRPHFFWTVSHWLSVRDGSLRISTSGLCGSAAAFFSFWQWW